LQHETIQQLLDRFKTSTRNLIKRGWSEDLAEAFALLSACRNSLSRALREKDACYAASTYKLSEALFASKQHQHRAEEYTLPPRLYFHRKALYLARYTDIHISTSRSMSISTTTKVTGSRPTRSIYLIYLIYVLWVPCVLYLIYLLCVL
jgi:hypothetical protein